jgi:hypothetical protein
MADRGPFRHPTACFHRKLPPPAPFFPGLSSKTPSFPAALPRQCEKSPLVPPAALPSGQTSPAAVLGQGD